MCVCVCVCVCVGCVCVYFRFCCWSKQRKSSHFQMERATKRFIFFKELFFVLTYVYVSNLLLSSKIIRRTCRANCPWNWGSILGRVIPKIQKMILEATLLNTHHYKVRIEGKVEQSRLWSSTLPYTSVSSYWKGSLRSTLYLVRQLIYIYIYIYITWSCLWPWDWRILHSTDSEDL